MVKPTLKPESEKGKKDDALKDDKLKEWGVLPAVVVIDEKEKENDKKDAEAAFSDLDSLTTDVDDAPRPLIVKFCACFAVFTILLVVFCTIGSLLYFHYGNSDEHKWKGWCSVKYNDDNGDNDSWEKGRHDGRHGGRSSSEEGGRNHNNALYPRPTGPPGGRTCNQESQVDVDNQLERVERPPEEDCERLTILHDYNVNISAYRLWNSEVCYVTWIEEEVLMNPEEFWTNMQDPEFLNQYFSELSMTYRAVVPAIPTPLHEQENGKYGEYLDGPKDFLCDGVETYWIEKISEEEIEAFMELINQVIQELMELAAASDDYYQQPQEWPQPEGQPGIPFPGGEGGQGGEALPELPWGDDGGYMPTGGHDGRWPMEGWPMGDHGMDDGQHYGHQGEHHSGHGMRRRRGIRKLKKGNRKTKTEQEIQDAKACLAAGMPSMTQIGKGNSVFKIKLVRECIMKKVQEKIGDQL